MKSRPLKLTLWLWPVAVLTLVTSSKLLVQTNRPPIRLAIISKTSEAMAVVDLLTVEFSRKPQLQLLEREQIERVYREQGLSAENRDFLKLGQVLGAEGLLLLDSVEEEAAPTIRPPAAGNRPFATTAALKVRAINARLVAVKPGVVLAADRFMVEADKIPEWASIYVRRLQPLLPKLAVLAKDAIPVSVVNLRSAVSSSEAPELERQLQTLAVQRLSREPCLFVLERQKLQQVSEEKSLLADETAFWNGAWLLDGVVDQNSYSKSTITLDVKLTPGKGGKPVQFEVSGSRTNLTEVINGLAVKVAGALQIGTAAEEWKATDEAAQFYDEAKWALRWGVLAQADAAADAAWALGKRDLECAILRIRTRIAQVPLVLAPGSAMYARGKRVNFVNIDEPPDARFCDLAGQALECYVEFSRVSPDGEPKVLTRGPGWNDWRNSEWYQLGIETLETAARVLQHFNYSPAAQKAAPDKLAALRGKARAGAELIFNAPTVRDSYYVGNRIANHDELAHTMNGVGSIFACMLTWGCFWQERPEDAVMLYRRLMASPVFCYIHDGFWKRDGITPRLVGWNEADRKRIPQVWQAFWDELNTSTNLLWRMEAKALAATDAKDKAVAEQAREEWWRLVRSNRAELVGNNVELFYLGWKFESNSETEAMNREYWDKTVPAFKVTSTLEDQKKFLREHQPYEFQKFVAVFREKSYSQQQALELLPLIDTYKSNLLAKAQQADRSQKLFLESNARSVDTFLRRGVEKIAHPEAQPAPQQLAKPAQTSPPRPARLAKPLEVVAETSEAVTNIILVKKFLEIPLEGLATDTLTAIHISAHHWFSGKLVLDLQLGRAIYSRDAGGKWQSTRYAGIPAIAILDTESERWQVIECLEANFAERNQFYHHTALWRGDVFTSQSGKVWRYDLARKTWIDLALPDVGNCGLFVVNDRLYGATRDLIVEILEGGTSMHILASNRRQPPASALDSETLGAASGYAFALPALFGNSAGQLRVLTASKVFSWTGADWSAVCSTAPGMPQISDDVILFVGDGWSGNGVWRLPTSGDRLEYCLGPKQTSSSRSVAPAKSLWESPKGLKSSPLGLPESSLSAASRGLDLLVILDHSKTENIVNERERVITGTRILPQDGYHASLLCFSSNYAEPQKLYLKFDDRGGEVLPVSGRVSRGPRLPGSSSPWLCVRGERLYLGREAADTPLSGGRVGDLPKAGVWVVSLEQLDAEIARQKKVQDVRQEQMAIVTQQAARKLLEDFDRDHDGLVDGAEIESALTNEAFVASQLTQIDTNQNGWLDSGELAFFDANKNLVLDANEQAGVEYALSLFAAQLVRTFDLDNNGLLDRREFSDLLQSSPGSRTRPMMNSPFFDDNHDGLIDVEEIQALCRFQIGQGLSERPFAAPMMPGSASGNDPKQRFKEQVDRFWQKGGTNAVWQTKRPGFPESATPAPVQSR